MAKSTVPQSQSNWSLLVLRLGLGWYFTYAGWTKVITYFTEAKDWTATGFLMGVKGPFQPLFSGMVNNVIIDYLNAYGLLFIGLASLLGLCMRWTSFWAVILMVLYWAAAYPAPHSLFIDDHLIYAASYLVLMMSQSGRILGLDNWLLNSTFLKRNSWLKWFIS